MITQVLESIDNFLYAPILIIIMAAAGLYFTVRTRFVQLRLFGEACKLILEPPAGKKTVSSFQALMVSTASRVGRRSGLGLLDVGHVYHRRGFRIYGKYACPDLQARG